MHRSTERIMLSFVTFFAKLKSRIIFVNTDQGLKFKCIDIRKLMKEPYSNTSVLARTKKKMPLSSSQLQRS